MSVRNYYYSNSEFLFSRVLFAVYIPNSEAVRSVIYGLKVRNIPNASSE